MTVETDDYSIIKRKLILRDALTFLSLSAVTVVLFLVTLFLFRSFAFHRDDLAKRWSARGQAGLSSGRPEEAIFALHAALSYAPGERSYELLLAQALGEAGHTEESYNYFLSLWETQPGDGFINLNLARLAAKRNDAPAAINYYHAAIYGTWEGDGATRRREVRVELARFLIAHHDPSSARAVILIAGGNAPGDVPLDLTLAELLERAEDSADALNYYNDILSHDPENREALIAAGRLQYQSGNFEEAHHLFGRASQERGIREHRIESSRQDPLPADVQAMFENTARILTLAPLKTLPPAERVMRILKTRDIAKKRFDACIAGPASPGAQSSSLQNLSSAWASKDATTSRSVLLRDPSAQESAMKLVFDTEMQCSQICGAPAGDDALLLLLVKYPKTMEH